MSIRNYLRWRPSGPDLEAFYRSEVERDPYSGSGQDGLNPEYVYAEEAEALLVPDAGGLPPVRLVATPYGFEFALPDHRLLHYEVPALRRFDILTCSTTAMSYFENTPDQLNFRNGQQLRAIREPDNAYDPNAVILATRRPARKFGYVNQDRAGWVAQALDSGMTLHAVVLQNRKYGPRVLIATADMLTYLCRAGG